ncbi:MAG: SelB C-terminal domain-containing protein [Lautropia sp.]|nr:SelB C-terminal domain-containing protein [Lautropia sp.]
MIIGTAGHIDHGKSSLVKALTGVDTDRLPEEKQRGMSIELGYAFMPIDRLTPVGTPRPSAMLADDGAVRPGTAQPSMAERAGTGAAGRQGRAQPGAGPEARIGFIDVPGHEKLVHTMIAGATGIDFALLLVAADDGVMPQTREHLVVLSLLGIRRGAVALTKIDRVEAARVATVQAEVEALLAGSSLAGVPIMPVSVVSGEGIEALRALLLAAATALGSVGGEHDEPCAADVEEGQTAASVEPILIQAQAQAQAQAPAAGTGLPREEEGLQVTAGASIAGASPSPLRAGHGFRLAIDRVFSLDGTGTVVTGTVHAGSVKVGDLLDQAPGGLRGLRVRSLHAQNRKTEEAHAGQRCAIGLAGVSRDALQRGEWLVQPGLSVATDRFDAQLTLWPGEPRALKTGTKVHLHLGTTMCLASVAVLDRETLAPGDTALAQLVLPKPLAAWHGERFILRDAAGQRVVAGGQVLDVRAPVRYRRTAQRLHTLAALQQVGLPRLLRDLLAAEAIGLNLSDWQQRLGLADTVVLEQALKGLPHRRLSPWWVMDEAVWARLQDQVLTALDAFHAQQPDELGPDAARLRRLTRVRLDEEGWRAVLAALQAAGEVQTNGPLVHRPGHGVALAARDQVLMEKILPMLAEAGAQGAWVRDLAAQAGEPVEVMRAAMGRLARSGRVHQIVKDLYQDDATTTALGLLFRSLIDEVFADPQALRPSVTVARFRDASGLGRKRAVQVLEFFDRIGLCRRVGDEHLLRPESLLFRDG